MDPINVALLDAIDAVCAAGVSGALTCDDDLDAGRAVWVAPAGVTTVTSPGLERAAARALIARGLVDDDAVAEADAARSMDLTAWHVTELLGWLGHADPDDVERSTVALVADLVVRWHAAMPTWRFVAAAQPRPLIREPLAAATLRSAAEDLATLWHELGGPDPTAPLTSAVDLPGLVAEAGACSITQLAELSGLPLVDLADLLVGADVPLPDPGGPAPYAEPTLIPGTDELADLAAALTAHEPIAALTLPRPRVASKSGGRKPSSKSKPTAAAPASATDTGHALPASPDAGDSAPEPPPTSTPLTPAPELIDAVAELTDAVDDTPTASSAVESAHPAPRAADREELSPDILGALRSLDHVDGDDADEPTGGDERSSADEPAAEERSAPLHGTDTAALLRELSSLSAVDDQPAPTTTHTSAASRRRGLFSRG